MSAPSHPFFSLPAYTVGPYHMQVVAADKDMFEDKRRVLEHDWTAGVVRIASHLSMRRALECMMRSLVSAVHYRSGLNDNCDEEAYTHSLATGLTELARSSPEFWAHFQQLVEDEYKPGAGWGRTASGNPVASALTAPKRLVLDDKTCTLEWVPHQQVWRENAFAFFYPTELRIELSDELHSTNMALITLHEVVHFLHHCTGLDDPSSDADFRRVQAHTLLRFWQQNPKFWAWWLNAAHPLMGGYRDAA